jgi:2-polyprenyl-3-methyl-5-hydroxy-6-metoxy-1,4-benzoquinol methylase
VLDGILKCQCGQAYIVHQGVPKMLTSTSLPEEFLTNYRQRLLQDVPSLANVETTRSPQTFSFSYQWSNHAYNDLTWEVYLPERVEIFYRYCDITPAQAVGCRLLDAGCGNGTLSAELAAQGFEVVSLDYSDSVYRAYQYKLFESRVTNEVFDRLQYVQGDVRQPPLKSEFFDLVYCDGVLHHTPDTKASFMALAKVVKPGGRFLVWLYRSDTKPIITVKNALVDLVWFLTRNLSYQNKMRLCYVAAVLILLGVHVSHLFGYKKRRLIPLRQKAVNLFDTISPKFNHRHTPEEVASWFREAGYTDIKDVSISDYRLDEGGFAIIGTRGKLDDRELTSTSALLTSH